MNFAPQVGDVCDRTTACKHDEGDIFKGILTDIKMNVHVLNFCIELNAECKSNFI